jgi:hypothetical protein
MRNLDTRIPRRITGRPALERRCRALLLAIHRFGRGRATTRPDVLWAARAIDSLTVLLDSHQQGDPTMSTMVREENHFSEGAS